MRAFEFRKMQMASIALCALFFLKTVAYARADEPIPQPFDIAPQPLQSALTAFARQSHEEILFAPEVVAAKRTAGVKGTMTPLIALKVLLNDSGLPFSSTPGGAILVGNQNFNAVRNTSPILVSAANDQPGKEVDKSSGSFRVAQVDQGATRSSAVTATTESSVKNPNAGPTLTEIVVTAQKREERLQDVPVPVSAIGADTLVESNQLTLNDYYTRVPALSISNDGYHSLPTLAIRGITTGGFANPTVAILVDDVPFSSSTTNGKGLLVPDFDVSDLERIEVLRGPQGTLYGANSMGGLLKYVTVDPSTQSLSGRLQVGGNDVHNGAEAGYNVRGAVNVPVTDTLAIRASAFTREDPGYIDNPILHANGINEDHVDGGRVSVLFRPSDTVSLKVGALYQELTSEGVNFVDVAPGLGDLQQDNLRGTGAYTHKQQLYSATLNMRLGSVDLTAVSGYGIYDSTDDNDLSPFYTSLVMKDFAVTGTAGTEKQDTRKFTQEIRLSSSVAESFDWMGGLFYTHERSSPLQNAYPVDAATGAFAGQLDSITFPNTYAEYAAFADLTYHFTRQFDVQLGGRESRDKQTYQETDSGLLFDGTIVNPEFRSSENTFTYLVTPEYKFSADLMTYARFASGYRPGSPNTAAAPGIPAQSNVDKTYDYELGIKGDILPRVLTFDASVYYIDWKDIQLSLLSPNGFGYYANGGGAKSRGVELQIAARPLNGMTITSWVAFNDSELTQNLPAGSTAFGLSGARLPTTSRFSGNISADQEFPLMGANGFVGANLSYMGDRLGVFTATPERQYFPSYAQFDLHGGVRYSSWTINIYATNLADKRAALAGGLGSGPYPYAFIFNRPRTIGADLTWRF